MIFLPVVFLSFFPDLDRCQQGPAVAQQLQEALGRAECQAVGQVLGAEESLLANLQNRENLNAREGVKKKN